MPSLRRRSRIASLLTVGAVSTALVLSGCTVDEDSDQSSEDLGNHHCVSAVVVIRNEHVRVGCAE